MIRDTGKVIPASSVAARAAASLIAVFLLALFASCSDPPVVEPGKQISLLYEASDPSGELVDVNPDEGPLVFVVGTGKLQPKVEAELIGMHAGEEKTFTIADAYGAYNPKKTATLSRKAFAGDVELKVGDYVPMAGGMPSKIKEIHDTYVLLDLNHPLAGKEITFNVEVAEVKDPEPPGAPAAAQAPVESAPAQPSADAKPAAQEDGADPAATQATGSEPPTQAESPAAETAPQ